VLIEALDRLLARAVSPLVSAFYAGLHRAHGVELRLGCGVREIRECAGGAEIELNDGSAIATDCVVAGIGVVPNSELAADCGLACNNGIVVDGAALTSDPDIVSAGDCTWHYNGFLGREIRLESVQNAVDQAKVAAASLCGENPGYYQVPWFWSDQYDVKLQIAGIALPHDAQVVRGEVGPQGYSVFYYRDARLVAADSVNRPAEHMACRKLLMQGTMLAPEAAADPAVDLLALTRP
jgi:3-phenylpropionate/trans-cinnamate dioxygenase ferredoxin reductase component